MRLIFTLAIEECSCERDGSIYDLGTASAIGAAQGFFAGQNDTLKNKQEQEQGQEQLPRPIKA
jgi:hypothetical protein